MDDGTSQYVPKDARALGVQVHVRASACVGTFIWMYPNQLVFPTKGEIR